MDSTTIVKHLSDQLDWTGPSGKTMSHILINREEAEWLRTLLNSKSCEEYEQAQKILTRT